MNKLNAFVVTAMLAVITQAGTTTSVNAGTLDDIIARGELRVLYRPKAPRSRSWTRTATAPAAPIELTKLMAEEMGVKVVYLDFDWDGLLPALMSGKADILAADMTPTLARATKVAFTKPFIYVGSGRLRQGWQHSSRSIEDCKSTGVTIAVLLGSTGEKLAATVFPQGEIKSFKGGGTLLLDAVASGQADCGLNDNSAVAAQSAAYEAGTFTMFPELLSKEPLAYAVRYNSMDLLSWANLFIDTTTLDGRLQSEPRLLGEFGQVEGRALIH